MPAESELNLDDWINAFKEKRLSILNKSLAISRVKWFPSILKWSQYGVEVVRIYHSNSTIVVTVGKCRLVDICHYFEQKTFYVSDFCLIFGRRSASLNSIWNIEFNCIGPTDSYSRRSYTSLKGLLKLKSVFWHFNVVGSMRWYNVFCLELPCSLTSQPSTFLE